MNIGNFSCILRKNIAPNEIGESDIWGRLEAPSIQQWQNCCQLPNTIKALLELFSLHFFYSKSLLSLFKANIDSFLLILDRQESMNGWQITMILIEMLAIFLTNICE